MLDLIIFYRAVGKTNHFWLGCFHSNQNNNNFNYEKEDWVSRYYRGKEKNLIISSASLIGMSFLDLIEKIFNALCEAMKKSR